MTPQEMELILQLSDQRFLECLEAQPPRRRKLWMKTRCAIDPRLFARAFFFASLPPAGIAPSTPNSSSGISNGGPNRSKRAGAAASP